MITTIFWDNDGVLVDSEKWFYVASKLTLASAGINITEEMFIDISLKQGCSVMSLLKNKGLSEKEIIPYRKKRNEIYNNFLTSKEITVHGSEDVLKKLYMRYRMVVVTGSCIEHFNTQHAQTGFTKYFEKIFSAEDYDKQKPHPDSYITALKSLNLSPEEVVVIEDSPRGITAAKKAGLKVIAVKSGFAKYFDQNNADFIVNALNDVPAILEKM